MTRAVLEDEASAPTLAATASTRSLGGDGGTSGWSVSAPPTAFAPRSLLSPLPPGTNSHHLLQAGMLRQYFAVKTARLLGALQMTLLAQRCLSSLRAVAVPPAPRRGNSRSVSRIAGTRYALPNQPTRAWAVLSLDVRECWWCHVCVCVWSVECGVCRGLGVWVLFAAAHAHPHVVLTIVSALCPPRVDW